MKPAMLGVCFSTHASIPAWLPTSPLHCSMSTPFSSATFWRAFQFGMFSSAIFIERDSISILRPLQPCAIALSTTHLPMMFATAPFPPDMPTTVLSASLMSCPALPYSFALCFRNTYRPVLRIRTGPHTPNVHSRQTSEDNKGKDVSGKDHSVSMKCKGMSISMRAVLAKPQSQAFVMMRTPISSWISFSSAKVSQARHTIFPTSRLSSQTALHIMRSNFAQSFWCLCMASASLEGHSSIP
mmetsp:Transcript_37724/g.66333  ORF Transcript_37724/g.66333 Transcript_37724/m.66333 type:complete len:241 (+) Transcript_37724:725-1447(+)